MYLYNYENYKQQTHKRIFAIALRLLQVSPCVFLTCKKLFDKILYLVKIRLTYVPI